MVKKREQIVNENYYSGLLNRTDLTFLVEPFKVFSLKFEARLFRGCQASMFFLKLDRRLKEIRT